MADYWLTENEKARELLVREWEPIWGRPYYVRGTYRVSPDDVASWLLSQTETVRDSVLYRVGRSTHVADLDHANRLITDLGRQLDEARKQIATEQQETAVARSQIDSLKQELAAERRKIGGLNEALRQAYQARQTQEDSVLRRQLDQERTRAERAEETLRAILEVAKAGGSCVTGHL